MWNSLNSRFLGTSSPSLVPICSSANLCTNSSMKDSSPQVLLNSSTPVMTLNLRNPVQPSLLLPLCYLLCPASLLYSTKFFGHWLRISVFLNSIVRPWNLRELFRQRKHIWIYWPAESTSRWFQLSTDFSWLLLCWLLCKPSTASLNLDFWRMPVGEESPQIDSDEQLAAALMVRNIKGIIH